jgi:polyisoprenoid-binding protein YceI
MRYDVGPRHGRLLLRTTRQGLAATAGHDLTIEVTRWRGEIVIAEDDPAAGSVNVTAETGSLRVVEGTGGVVPLTERDKREIARNAYKVLDAAKTPEATFTSTRITATTTDGTVEGTLSLRGRAQPLTLQVTALGDGRYRATGTVVQTRYGIKPYSAFFGALKLADAVQVEAELDLTAGDPETHPAGD